MEKNEKPIFYHCDLHGNRTSKKCPICKRTCRPVYASDIPFERNWANDNSRLDYILKNARNQKKQETE